jgi:hypothetical protein
VPHTVPLEPAQRAGAAERVRVGGFELVPPPGRWIAEPFAAGRALDTPELLIGSAGWRELVTSSATPSGDGVRLCQLRRVRWETAGGGATDPREGCASLQPIAFPTSEPPPSSARELAERLAPRARAVEVEYVGEPDFWRGVAWQTGRGEAALLRIGANDFVDLHLVARDEPTRILRAGGRMLLLVGPHGAHLAVLAADASFVAEGSVLQRALASLRPTAP